MKKLSIEEAKDLFFRYDGSKTGIERDLGDVYRNCKIPPDVEAQWVREIKNNLSDKIRCGKGSVLYSAIRSYCNLLKPADANTFLTDFLSNHAMDSFTRLLLCELMKAHLKYYINEKMLFKKTDEKKELWTRFICDQKNLLLSSPFRVDPSYPADRIGYDFSEDRLRERIESL